MARAGGCPRGMGVARQFLQNAAAIRFFRTRLLQIPQLPLQRAQLRDTVGNMLDMLVQNTVYLAAVLRRLVTQL